MKALLAVALSCMLGGIASAHPLDTAYLRVEAHGATLDVTFDLDVALASQELAVEPGALDGVLGVRAGELAGKLYRSATPTSTAPCTWGTPGATRKGVTVTLRDVATCPDGEVRWDLSFGKRLATTFQILGKRVDARGEHVFTIDKTTSSLTIVTSNAMEVGTAVRRGLEATGILPAGWSHGAPRALDLVLFVMVLLLGARRFADQARDAGAAIAGLVIGGLAGGLAPGQLLAIPLLLAIAVTAIAVALGRLPRRRYLLATVTGLLFGIVHHEPLQPIGFAAGLALGAAAIVIVLGPVFGTIRRDGTAGRVLQLGALVAGAVAACWVIV